MPPPAARNRPSFLASAPVNAPFSWPNSSLSSSASGSAAQLIATNGLLCALAALVQRARDQLLAGAALAGDQHARRRARDALDQAHDALHRRALADDVAGAEALLHALPQRAVLIDDRALLERLLDHRQQFVVLERLLDVVVGAFAHRLHGLRRGRVRGDHDHLRRVVDLARLGQHAHARAVGHREVGDDGVERRLLVQQRDRALLAFGDLDFVAVPLEQHVQHLAQARLIVDDEYPGAHPREPTTVRRCEPRFETQFELAEGRADR